MKLFGKEIPVQKVNFFTNIISFALGVMFFIRMQYKLNEKPYLPIYNAERDSLIVIQTRVNMQLNEIKRIQDSVIKIIRQNRITIEEQRKKVQVKRKELYATLHSEWDDLSRKDQENYVNKIMLNVNQKQK